MNEVCQLGLATVVRNAPIGIGICDEHGRLLSANTALAELLRLPTEQIVGRPFLSFIHPAHRAATLSTYFQAVVAAAAGVRHDDRKLRCLTGDGQVIAVWASWAVTDLEPNGTQHGIVYLTPEAAGQHPRPARYVDSARSVREVAACRPTRAHT
jgi:PAS domain S-box-containing protein